MFQCARVCVLRISVVVCVCTVLLCLMAVLMLSSFLSLALLQMDPEVRLQWDSYLSSMDVMERDPVTGSDLLHWVIKLPVSEPTVESVAVAPPTTVCGTSPTHTSLWC